MSKRDEFLSEEQSIIVDETFRELRLDRQGHDWPYMSFWSLDEVCLDGNFELEELQALVKAMERMRAVQQGQEDVR